MAWNWEIFVKRARRSHLSIGLPFIATVLFGTYGLTFLLQTKIDYQSEMQHMLDRSEELMIEAKKEKFDIRKAYFDLLKDNQGKDDEDFEMVYLGPKK